MNKNKKDNIPPALEKYQWEPGKPVYSEWLASLTPEEYKQHVAYRKARREMKKAWKEILEFHQAKWISALNYATAKAMKKALKSGDINDLKKLAELLGATAKDVDVNVSSDMPLPWNDDDL